MTDREPSERDEGMDRRTMLKGTAAAGLAGTGFAGTASADERKHLRFKAAGDPTFSYRVSVSGEIKREANRDGGDTKVDENTAEGAASRGRFDDWLFTGEITELELDGPGQVLVEGEVVTDTTEPSNTITIEADEEHVEYEFRVNGHVEKGPRAEANDRIDENNVVRGAVGGGGVDDYEYTGALVFEDADGPLTVTLDIDGS